MDKSTVPITVALITAAAAITVAIISKQTKIDINLSGPYHVISAPSTIEQGAPKPNDGTRPSTASPQQPKRDHDSVLAPETRHSIKTPIEWSHQECHRDTLPDEKFGNDKPSEKDELIKNPNFKYFYEPEWIALVNDKMASIKPSENFVSISFDGESNNTKAVELYQVINISDPSDLMFNLRIKISDLDYAGYPVADLTLMDETDKEVFRIIFTPDKTYDSKANECIYQTRNGSLEDIAVSPLESARKWLLLANYAKSTKAKVSFYIAVPSGYRCRKCTIEVHNVSLRHSERRN